MKPLPLRDRRDRMRVPQHNAEVTSMFSIIGAIISGLIVGVLARFFYPGAVEMGWLWTIGLGIAGSLLAGLVVNRGRAGFSSAGWIASIIGGIVLIFVGRMLNLG